MERGGLCDRVRHNLARLREGAPRSSQDNDILDQVHRDLEQIELQLSWLNRGQRSIDERLAKIEQQPVLPASALAGREVRTYSEYRDALAAAIGFAIS
jgi:hypothetical protein